MQYSNIIYDISKKAGYFLLEHFNKVSDNDIVVKTRNDFVTYVDTKSEEMIKNMILKHFPNSGFLAEESGEKNINSELIWVIDPLDGTTNFISGIPHFCISIALIKNNELYLGAIYNPLLDEFFYAEKKLGSFFNNKRIFISKTQKLQNAFGATGFPFKVHHFIDEYLGSFKELFLKSKGIRRCGSAALDIAYTACGRYDYFWEAYLKPWDFLAGKLILEEAGGIITNFKREHLWLEENSVIGTNEVLYEEIINIIDKYFYS